MLRVLVSCEESQRVCIAFRELGHEAYSCDILPCSGNRPEWHIQDDVLKHLNDEWDLMIAHPPCTKIAYSGTQVWNKPGRVFERLEALQFFAELWEAPIPHICIENPKSCASPVIAKYTQEIQPYYFGDTDIKTTWLWLKNLPLLEYTLSDDLFGKTESKPRPGPLSVDSTGKLRYFADSKIRDPQERSKTFPSIAKAMATQWSAYLEGANRC